MTDIGSYIRSTVCSCHRSTTKISWLKLFKKIIAVNSENHMGIINILCVKNAEVLTVKKSGI